MGAQLDFKGLYLDSETAPGSKMSFSTFGDGVSTPRLLGLPDVFDGIENATQDWKKLPDVYAALQSEYVLLLLLAIDEAGQVMNGCQREGYRRDTRHSSFPPRRAAESDRAFAYGHRLSP